MARCNLTVIFDGCPVTGKSFLHLPEFYAKNKVEVISSLPYYQEFFTDKQRGKGVFNKSIEGIRLLNEQGFGVKDTGLSLNLVYNPVGTFLPGKQEQLETDFKRELKDKFGLVFNALFVVTNMPIHRFREDLTRSGNYESYLQKLETAFNPAAAANVMCRSMLSVAYDGSLYDCDFNQQMDLQISADKPLTIWDFDKEVLANRKIKFLEHCFGCTAGAGSSCGGVIE
jgi:radical SAM/Cys-rich protein